jgi:ribosome-binding factor A
MSIRTARVAEEIQKVLGERLVRGLRDPLPGFVTIRSVEVTSDFAHAKVFVSVFGSDADKQGAIAGLRAQRGALRKELGSKVRLRLTPELTFVLDESGERAARVHALLDAVKDGRPAPADDVDGGGTSAQPGRRGAAASSSSSSSSAAAASLSAAGAPKTSQKASPGRPRKGTPRRDDGRHGGDDKGLDEGN